MASSLKSQSYYFEDVEFQMELNLQNTRRDLIDQLEQYQFQDCLVCNRLKCCCSMQSSVPSSISTLSVASSDSAFPNEYDRAAEDFYFNAAPPADTLPRPRWPEVKKKTSKEAKKPKEKETEKKTLSLNNWIKASIPYVAQSTTRVTFPVPRKLLEDVNYSWPPFPKSIWSDERLQETTTRERIFSYERERDGNRSVEAFFKYWQIISDSPALIGPDPGIPNTLFANGSC